MGGSLGLALRGRVAQIIGIARRPASIQQALELGAIDRGYSSLAEGLVAADVVVLATPISVIMRQIREIGQAAAGGGVKPGLLVLDLGSTKSLVCQALSALPDGVEPVGGHPMCGKESSGLDVAEGNLYREAAFVLCPLPRTGRAAIALAEALVLAAGACPIYLDPELHDRLASTISHVPYIVSTALFASAVEASTEDDTLWQLAASGFRSSTRVAGSDDKMMTDILLTNRAAVLAQIDRVLQELTGLRRLIAGENQEMLRLKLAKIREQRASFLETYGE